MSKRVVLNFGRGSFETGFPSVTAELWETNGVRSQQLIGSLPSAPEIITCYREWKHLYNALAQRLRLSLSIEIESASLTNVSQDDLHGLCQRLQVEINYWLNAETFRKIDQKLRTWLSHTEEVWVVIETSDDFLWRLPWHLWEFVKDYPQSEVVLSLLESKQVASTAQTAANQVRVLAILGDSRGIDISTDKNLLKSLPGIVPTFLLEPDRQAINDALWQQTWDILFFAGHSSSQAKDGKAKISINQNQENHSLTINQLEYALSKAIEQGLQLAIFNSCDGLGLAKQLVKLNIPQIIVMREDVPNAVAQEFLKYFLEELARGESLAMAVRRARERLQGLENEHPCASWLPVICQNSPSELSIWQKRPDAKQPVQKHHPAKPTQNRKHILIVMMLVSFIVSSLVMGVRYLGWLQSSELYAFDRFMQTRSQLFPEQPDNRLLIITIDEPDIQYQENEKMHLRWSLSDEALAELLQKLDAYQPRAIGLDLYRDVPLNSQYPDLATRFQKDDRLITLCKSGTTGDDGDTYGSVPPPKVPNERISFSDVVADEDDVIRRHLLSMTPLTTSLCVAEDAFSFKLALHYLDKKEPQYQITADGDLQIRDVIFPQLKEHSSGYQNVDTGGYQLLLNYRSLASVDNIAQQISLTDILSDRIRPEQINSLKDRLILIGLSAQNKNNDLWKTPFSDSARPLTKKIPGVFIQAQMVSQVISAVLDERPLLWWWSSWIELLWLWLWSFLGAIFAIYKFKLIQRILATSIELFSLWSICLAVFIQGGWIPFIPAILAFLTTQLIFVYRLKK
ncbi:CHASE2 domain-containing protein [Nostoc sp. FACHB-973]|nr:CHASE2 domain-containing protein [Nostoc sp. FACHB-973]